MFFFFYFWKTFFLVLTKDNIFYLHLSPICIFDSHCNIFIFVYIFLEFYTWISIGCWCGCRILCYGEGGFSPFESTPGLKFSIITIFWFPKPSVIIICKVLINFYFGLFLGDQNFINKLIAYDKDNISDKMLKKISSHYVNQSDFRPEIVGRVSLAAKSLCLWVRAMEMYGRVFRVVQPKQQRLNVAMKQLNEKQEALAKAQEKLKEVCIEGEEEFQQ